MRLQVVKGVNSINFYIVYSRRFEEQFIPSAFIYTYIYTTRHDDRSSAPIEVFTYAQSDPDLRCSLDKYIYTVLTLSHSQHIRRADDFNNVYVNKWKIPINVSLITE